MPHILLTNDDGYQAEGLRALAAALEGFATVSIVAPSKEQSGTAQSLTLRQPIVCNKIAERQREIHAAITKNHAQPIKRRERSTRPQLLLAIRTKARQERGAGHRLRRDFFRRRLHHAAAPRSHAHQIAESSFTLGQTDRS